MIVWALVAFTLETTSQGLKRYVIEYVPDNILWSEGRLPHAMSASCDSHGSSEMPQTRVGPSRTNLLPEHKILGAIDFR